LADAVTTIDLAIAPEFKAEIPGVAVGWLTAIVRNSPHDEALWREIEATVNCFKNVTMETARRMPPIKVLRDAATGLAAVLLEKHAGPRGSRLASSRDRHGNQTGHDRGR
jgi:hypothetical protein